MSRREDCERGKGRSGDATSNCNISLQLMASMATDVTRSCRSSRSAMRGNDGSRGRLRTLAQLALRVVNRGSRVFDMAHQLQRHRTPCLPACLACLARFDPRLMLGPHWYQRRSGASGLRAAEVDLNSFGTHGRPCAACCRLAPSRQWWRIRNPVRADCSLRIPQAQGYRLCPRTNGAGLVASPLGLIRVSSGHACARCASFGEIERTRLQALGKPPMSRASAGVLGV